MITINLIKKEKGRVYKSEMIVRELFGLELFHDENGAPLLKDATEDACRTSDSAVMDPGTAQVSHFISISDTRNYWACAVSDFPMGIDIEELSRKVNPSIVRKFHKDEQEYLAVLSEGSREWTEELFSIWTRKEAYSKYTKKGYSIGFSKFSVLENSVDGVPLGYFAVKGLMFGFAGEAQAQVVRKSYDAPMELSALDYAAGLLDVRAYSAAEITAKLKDRGYKEAEISEALEKLKDYGFVNDRAYAENFAQHAVESGKSSRHIESELRQKGLEKDLAREAAAEHKEDEYERALEIAKSIAEKERSGVRTISDDPDDALYSESSSDAKTRFEAKKQEYARRQKLAGRISRKLSGLGYDAGIIYAVLEDVVR